MSACNKQPKPGHPMYRTGIACPWPAGHDGVCQWALEPSTHRAALDRLLTIFANRDIASIDGQAAAPVREFDPPSDTLTEMQSQGPPGPWVVVTFVGGDQYAIWKNTGDIYRVGLDGAVENDPMLPVRV